MGKSIVCVTYFDTLYLNKKPVFSKMSKIYCVFRDKLRASAQNLIVHRVWREHAISNVYGITAFAVGWRLSENKYGAHWILPYREPGHHEMRHAFAIVDCLQIIAMPLFRQMLPKQWCVWLPHGIFVSIDSIHCGIVRARASQFRIPVR